MKLKAVLGLMSLVWITALACNLAPSLPDNVAATAEVAAKQAQEAAATAAVVAATVAAQGQDLAATVQASDFDFSDLGALQERFTAVIPDENGNINIALNDAELTTIIQARQAEAVAQGEAPNNIQNPTVQFTGGTIVFRGDVVDPIEAPLSATFRPIVEDGVLRFELVGATVGTINVPPSLLQAAESSLNGTLGTAVEQLPANITLQDVVVGEGTLNILGQYQQN